MVMDRVRKHRFGPACSGELHLPTAEPGYFLAVGHDQ
jgi:hypothetical protein